MREMGCVRGLCYGPERAALRARRALGRPLARTDRVSFTPHYEDRLPNACDAVLRTIFECRLRRRGEPSSAHARVVGEQDAPQRGRFAQRVESQAGGMN